MYLTALQKRNFGEKEKEKLADAAAACHGILRAAATFPLATKEELFVRSEGEARLVQHPAAQ